MQWRRSRVTDPTTGRPRPISEEKPVEGSIELTQDLPALRTHWDIELEHIAERKTEYRYDEIKRESEGMGWTVFVERELGTHWRVRAEASDLFGRGFKETRDEVRRAALDRAAGGDRAATAAVAGGCEFDVSAECGGLSQGRSKQTVIPAKAGIQRLGSCLKTLDSSFRWNDEQKIDQHILRTRFRDACFQPTRKCTLAQASGLLRPPTAASFSLTR